MLVMRAWLIIGALIASGCGDIPSACKQCPAGTECRQKALKPSDPWGAQRFECVKVLKEVMGLSTDDGSGPGEGPRSDTAVDGGGLEGIDE